jgi:hypothetical protein
MNRTLRTLMRSIVAVALLAAAVQAWAASWVIQVQPQSELDGELSQRGNGHLVHERLGRGDIPTTRAASGGPWSSTTTAPAGIACGCAPRAGSTWPRVRCRG